MDAAEIGDEEVGAGGVEGDAVRAVGAALSGGDAVAGERSDQAGSGIVNADATVPRVGDEDAAVGVDGEIVGAVELGAEGGAAVAGVTWVRLAGDVGENAGFRVEAEQAVAFCHFNDEGVAGGVEFDAEGLAELSRGRGFGAAGDEDDFGGVKGRREGKHEGAGENEGRARHGEKLGGKQWIAAERGRALARLAKEVAAAASLGPKTSARRNLGLATMGMRLRNRQAARHRRPQRHRKEARTGVPAAFTVARSACPPHARRGICSA